MAVIRYVVDAARCKVVVRARSSVHDTDTVWSRVSGTIDVDPDAPAEGATARLVVDMREFDAGDRLKNWKVKSDLEPDKYPEASFTLARLERVTGAGAGKWEAAAAGAIEWRGRRADVVATGSATITPANVSARARFELNVTHLGVKPPKVLMFKVDEVVSVEVTLEASALRA